MKLSLAKSDPLTSLTVDCLTVTDCNGDARVKRYSVTKISGYMGGENQDFLDRRTALHLRNTDLMGQGKPILVYVAMPIYE